MLHRAGEILRSPARSATDACCPSLSQLFYLALFIFVLALVGVFYPYNRGALYTALIVLYALTACIAGFVASSYYKQMEGDLWVRNILMTCFVYCGPFLIMFAFLNTVAIFYRVRMRLRAEGPMLGVIQKAFVPTRPFQLSLLSMLSNVWWSKVRIWRESGGSLVGIWLERFGSSCNVR